MVLKLLILCGCMSYDCPSREHEVRTGVVKRLVYKEIFLLYSKIDLDRPDIVIEKACHRSCGIIQGA